MGKQIANRECNRMHKSARKDIRAQMSGRSPYDPLAIPHPQVPALIPSSGTLRKSLDIFRPEDKATQLVYQISILLITKKRQPESPLFSLIIHSPWGIHIVSQQKELCRHRCFVSTIWVCPNKSIGNAQPSSSFRSRPFSILAI
jgi:hypothetical protein